MPELTDWFPANALEQDRQAGAPLLFCVGALSETARLGEHMQAIEPFIASQNPTNPTAQSIAFAKPQVVNLKNILMPKYP